MDDKLGQVESIEVGREKVLNEDGIKRLLPKIESKLLGSHDIVYGSYDVNEVELDNILYNDYGYYIFNYIGKTKWDSTVNLHVRVRCDDYYAIEEVALGKVKAVYDGNGDYEGYEVLIESHYD